MNKLITRCFHKKLNPFALSGRVQSSSPGVEQFNQSLNDYFQLPKIEKNDAERII